MAPGPSRIATVLFCCWAALLAGCNTTSQDAATAPPGAAKPANPPALVETAPPALSAQPDAALPDREVIAQVQSDLHRLGYDPGPVDGVAGPRTEAAIKAYQNSKEISPDGRVTEQLASALSADAAGLPPTAPPDSEPVEPVEPIELAKPEPGYQPGSRYLYANGLVHSVAAIEGSRVRWRSNQGELFVRHRNFLVPALTWSTDQEDGQRVVESPLESLWLNRAETQIDFTAKVVVRLSDAAAGRSERYESWRCRHGGSETMTVAAGTFETDKMICSLHTEGRSVALVRTWYYAPVLRHFVRLEESGAQASSRLPLELVAIQPSLRDWPPAAQAGLEWAQQHALDSLPEGERLPWHSSAVQVGITIEPGPQIDWLGPERCRRFRQIWSEAGETRVFPGVACRDKSGTWSMPDLTSGGRIAQATNF